MRIITRVAIARTALATQLAYDRWQHTQNRETTTALLQRTAAVLRELATALYGFALHNESHRIGMAETFVTQTGLLAVLCDTSLDADMTRHFKPHHMRLLPGPFTAPAEPLTPDTLPLDVLDELALLDSYWEREGLDEPRTFSVFIGFARLADSLASEVYRYIKADGPTDAGQFGQVELHASDTAALARTIMRGTL